MRNPISLLAFAVACACATSANAATITYNDQGVTTYLQQFNPLLGTLQSVTFNNRYVVTNSYNYNGDPSVQTGPLVRVTGTVGEPRYGRVAVDEFVQAIRQQPNVISVTVSKTVNTTFTADLAYYTGFTKMLVAGFIRCKHRVIQWP